MKVMATAAPQARTYDRLWRLVAAAVLLAFGFQAYLAQTHLHEAAMAKAAAGAIHYAGHDKSPAQNPPLDCPVCQIVTHASAFLISDAPFLFLAPQWITTAAPSHSSADTGATASHYWQSRAPPITDR
jgi:hypothetical protein